MMKKKKGYATAGKEELKEAFRIYYDKEGNGYITTEILNEIWHEIDPVVLSTVTTPPFRLLGIHS